MRTNRFLGSVRSEYRFGDMMVLNGVVMLRLGVGRRGEKWGGERVLYVYIEAVVRNVFQVECVLYEGK